MNESRPSLFQGLKPEALFFFFEEISSIPRASGNEKEIADYLCRFAQERHLPYHRDEKNNVVIKKEASPGRRDEAPLILQAHTDMVFVTDAAHSHHAPTRPVELCLSGKDIYAKGTSLGADNGAGVAMMLAVADDSSLSHPPLELVFTSSEEIGLLGASALDLRLLQGKRMINLDNDDEGIAVIGCAGGRRIDGAAPLSYRTASKRGGIRFCLKGLKGGHSGAEIHLGRTNALKAMAELLEEFSLLHPFALSEFSGGTVDNAIPSLCRGVLVPEENTLLDSMIRDLQELFEKKARSIRKTDPDAALELDTVEAQRCLDESQTKALIALMKRLPHGVRAMDDTTQVVQSSVNCAFCHTEENGVRVGLSVRSTYKKEKEALCRQVQEVLRAFGFEVSQRGDYPGWEPKQDSPLQALYRETYRKLTKKEPRCLPIHAGLECGIFAEGITDLDAISIGPNCRDIHTPRERLSADSFIRTYHLLTELLDHC